MAAPMPPQAGPNPEQMRQMQEAMATEARKRGMTPQQFQAQQRAQIEAEAKASGMTVPQYIQKLRAEALANHQRQQAAQAQQGQVQGQQGGQAQQHQHQHQQQQQIPINNSGTPDPKALAVLKWLRTQDLKTRTCILNGQRKDMFRVKRALRAIDSPAYEKAAAKTKSGLPQRTTEFPAAEILKLLPLSLLALRVTKVDDAESNQQGSSSKPKKRTKGLWTVKIEQQQEIRPDLHYVFLADTPSWKTQLYAVGALVAVFAVILFPLWPLKLRLGVWYLSMGMLGLIALFFAMAIFRLILFMATVFTIPPGFWLYPNLFEDVGFFDSFRPVWGWHETTEDKKAARKAKREAKMVKAEARAAKAKGSKGGSTEALPLSNTTAAGEDQGEESGEEEDQTGIPASITVEGATTTGADVGTIAAVKRDLKASVEEAGSESE